MIGHTREKKASGNMSKHQPARKRLKVDERGPVFPKPAIEALQGSAVGGLLQEVLLLCCSDIAHVALDLKRFSRK